MGGRGAGDKDSGGWGRRAARPGGRQAVEDCGLGTWMVGGWGQGQWGLADGGRGSEGAGPSLSALLLVLPTFAPSAPSSERRWRKPAAQARRRQPWLAKVGWLSPWMFTGSRGSNALTCAAAALCWAAGSRVAKAARPGPPPLLPAAQGHQRDDSVRSLGLGPRRSLG